MTLIFFRLFSSEGTALKAERGGTRGSQSEACLAAFESTCMSRLQVEVGEGLSETVWQNHCGVSILGTRNQHVVRTVPP